MITIRLVATNKLCQCATSKSSHAVIRLIAVSEHRGTWFVGSSNSHQEQVSVAAVQALRTTVQSPPPVGSPDPDPELPTAGRRIPSRSSLEQPCHSEIADAEHLGLEHLDVGGAVVVPVDVVDEEASAVESCSLVVACTLAFADNHLDQEASKSTVAGPDTADSKEVVRTVCFVPGSEAHEQPAPVCRTVGYQFAAEKSMRAAVVARSTAAGAHNFAAPCGTAAGSEKAAAQ